MVLWLSMAWAAPDAAALRDGWERHRSALDSHATYPFRFDEGEWSKLAGGAVMKRRERLDGTDRVLGVLWIEANLDTTWVAIHDPHGEFVDNTVYEVLPGSTVDRRYAYQRIGLPWPFTARQWVIEVVNNQALLTATEARVWERTWDLSDRRGATNEVPDAVWLPVNQGGWFLADVAGGTLLGYHVRTAVGGIVPDEAALRWSFSTLDGMLKRLAERTVWVRTHYVGEHAPVLRPGSTSIPVP